MKDKYNRLKEILADIEDDVNKFHDKHNKSAGLRVRKSMQELKGIAQDIRKYVLDKKNGVMH